MKQALEQLFGELQEIAQGNLDSPPDQGPDAATAPQASGDMPFEFKLDEDGVHIFETRQYGAGVTINAKMAIHDPSANYDVEVTSSTGGGGRWSGVGVAQDMDFKIETSFWTKTLVAIRISADKQNQGGWGTLSYSY